MPKKETFTSRFEETRGGRVPQKSKIWGDVFYGWSLMKKHCGQKKLEISHASQILKNDHQILVLS
jgi:hypothetical protein